MAAFSLSRVCRKLSRSGAVILPSTTALRALASRLGITTNACIAVGDGANDLSMMAEAGLGVAFHAKPAVRAATDANFRASHQVCAARWRKSQP